MALLTYSINRKREMKIRINEKGIKTFLEQFR